MKFGNNLFFKFFVLVLIFSSCKDRNTVEKKKANDFERPNVIFIITDDQGYGDVGFHGNTIIKTPNIDALAAKSTELTNFHVGTTCAPSRAGLMTGRNSNRNNAWHTIGGCSILNEEEQTMSEVFQENGYATAMFGKWHLGDNYPFRPHDRGFDNALYHGGGGVGQTPDYWNNDYFDDTYFRNGIPEKFEGYCTDVWFNETIKYIEDQADKPFFAYLALNAPHGPFNVPQEYLDMYADANLTDTQKRFYGMISNVDDNIGKLFKYLETSGKLENTILVFTTDNGTAAGIGKKNGLTTGYNANLRGTKSSPYEGGHRVPFLIHWPKGNITSKNQKKSNDLVAHVDILPTFAALCKLEYTPKNYLDGTDVSQVFQSNTKLEDRMLVVDTQRLQWPKKDRNSCVMQGEWRLVNGDELYNIETDISQTENLSDKFPERVKNMQAFYEDWWKSTEQDMHYSSIPLNTPNNENVLLTIHDLHSEDPIPWNQDLIRKGEQQPKGYYLIEITEPGNYQFDLYRYPPESNFAINDTVKEIASKPNWNGLAKGIGIKVVGGQIKLNDLVFKQDGNASESHVSVTGSLENGTYRLAASFITPDTSEFPAFYVNIIKI
ncbi:Arylsulfatase A [Maribacter dokdonensis]|uniref:Arylsulfatase A n=1 Tax=Maribacter dokdonensis TaxID=320912 RepID=A0A1H4UD51_9FLAO|nr:arylsulfatase [Maribacter dokdonensis]SEC66696.1 Arylsulfatase A [Maribacter dokdonensis]